MDQVSHLFQASIFLQRMVIYIRRSHRCWTDVLPVCGKNRNVQAFWLYLEHLLLLQQLERISVTEPSWLINSPAPIILAWTWSACKWAASQKKKTSSGVLCLRAFSCDCVCFVAASKYMQEQKTRFGFWLNKWIFNLGGDSGQCAPFGNMSLLHSLHTPPMADTVRPLAAVGL